MAVIFRPQATIRKSQHDAYIASECRLHRNHRIEENHLFFYLCISCTANSRIRQLIVLALYYFHNHFAPYLAHTWVLTWFHNWFHTWVPIWVRTWVHT
jgi:hypothetical protein